MIQKNLLLKSLLNTLLKYKKSSFLCNQNIPSNSILYLINLNINFMKKIRLEKSSTNTSALSHKRGSLNQDSLAQSCKPEWRGASPGNIENNHSSKVFFQNMKAELSNIKNDF
jgi:hypothetical protein